MDSDENTLTQQPADLPQPSKPLDDMNDLDRELPGPGRLRDALAACGEYLNDLYNTANEGALTNQRAYRVLSTIAVTCGTVAVLFAIVQLSGLFRAAWPLWAEAVAAAAAGLAVVLGLKLSKQSGWLLQRHKAERCRLLKFRSIIDTRLWCECESTPSDEVSWSEWFKGRAKGIESMAPNDLKEWVRAAQSDIPPKIKHCVLSDEEIRQLIDYYQAKRLDVQLRFFDKRAGDNRRYDRLLKKLPPVFFFASVGAVFAHFIVDIASGRHEFHAASVVLIAFAAALPVIGGGIRNFRGVYEFVRNANLFTQAGETLRQQRAELDKLMGDPSRCTPDCTHAESVLRAMWLCEQQMANEHREWMRLMLETEWYS